MRLMLVRHGATANNAEGRFTGQTDVALSPLGLRQAEAVADSFIGEPLAVIVSSDLARARQTAEIVAERTGAPLEFDPNLREIGMGAWEGLTFAEIRRQFPTEWPQWQDESALHTPPGGETLHVMLARATRTLERCQRDYADRSVLWVTHGGLIGALICHLLGVGLEHRRQLRRDNAAISELHLDGAIAILARLNDTAHLRDLPRTERAQVM
ncbi:MAG: histidine phosphatase family protein [Ktedonobacterales bacterium]